jgi:branched-chain amino acid aminotransferase
LGYSNVNGKLLQAEEASIHPDNSSFRYGVGLFETILVQHGSIRHMQYHMERLADGMRRLHFAIPKRFDSTFLLKEVHRTVEKNQLLPLCRVRLQVFAGSGGIFGPDDQAPQYVIECYRLEPEAITFNVNGLVAGVYTEAIKCADNFSDLKSSNALVYAMAGRHAKTNKWNDAFITNQHGRITESVIANVFVIKKGQIVTPPLSEGCVAGVMRRHLLHTVPGIIEQPITISDLEAADEVFLTNAIRGIRWVGVLGNKRFDNSMTRQLAAENGLL